MPTSPKASKARLGGSATAKASLCGFALPLLACTPDAAANAPAPMHKLSTTAQRQMFSNKGTWLTFTTPTSDKASGQSAAVVRMMRALLAKKRSHPPLPAGAGHTKW